MSRLISRDPFARTELHRENYALLPNEACTCSWCGQRRATNPPLFKYSIVGDGTSRRINYLKGAFCSVSCMRAYHD